MAFRGQPVVGAPAFATPTGTVDIGDAAVQGIGPAAASSQHVHAFPAPGVGYATYIAVAPADGIDTAPARAGHTHGHRAADHQAGGFADLTTAFLTKRELVFNVKDPLYGAVGDGVANDAPAIQAAIDAANTAGGGIVFLPVGVYRVAALLNLKSFVHLTGAGMGATIIRLANGINPTSALGIIQPNGYPPTAVGQPPAGYFIRNASVRHLSVDGNKANNATGTYECVEMSYTKDCLVFDVEAYNSTETGIHAQQTNTGADQLGVTRVIACVAHDCAADGFQFGGIIASHLHAYNNIQSGINIVGNYSGYTAADVTHVIAQVSHSRAENNTHTGVNVENQVGPDIKVQLDAIVSVGNGDYGFSFTMPGLTASRLDAYRNGADGVFVAGAQKQITGVVCCNNGQGSAHVYNQNSGINIFGTLNGLHLADIRCFDDQTPTQTQLYGIFVNTYTAGVMENVIDGGHLAGNKNGAINSLAMTEYRISDVFGVTPVGLLSGVGIVPATPAVPASTVTYTNRFGYPCLVIITGGTVTAVVIASATTGLTAGSFIVAPDQTISITYTAAPTWQWWGL